MHLTPVMPELEQARGVEVVGPASMRKGWTSKSDSRAFELPLMSVPTLMSKSVLTGSTTWTDRTAEVGRLIVFSQNQVSRGYWSSMPFSPETASRSY